MSSDNAFSLSLTGSEAGSTSVLEVSTDNGTTWTATTATSPPCRRDLPVRGDRHGCGGEQLDDGDTDGHHRHDSSHCGDAVAHRLHRYGQQQLGRSEQRQRLHAVTHWQRGGSTSVLEVSTDNGTTWTATTASQSGLADGTYLFRATVTDAAGNSSTTTTQTVTIDTTAPAAGTLSLTGFTDTGSSSSDGLSNDNAFSSASRQRGWLDLRARGLDG